MPNLFSIGHSNQSLESFVRLLTMHRIDVLVDVRSRPYSRYSPHFNARALKAAVIRAGISYLYLGKELNQNQGGIYIRRGVFPSWDRRTHESFTVALV